jgi:acetyl-CoA carboxylase alpha subunit
MSDSDARLVKYIELSIMADLKAGKDIETVYSELDEVDIDVISRHCKRNSLLMHRLYMKTKATDFEAMTNKLDYLNDKAMIGLKTWLVKATAISIIIVILFIIGISTTVSKEVIDTVFNFFNSLLFN